MEQDKIAVLASLLHDIGINGEVNELSMHLIEIEEEAVNVLDLLTTVRVHARCSEVDGGQDALAELTVALDHLRHHVSEVVPSLQQKLESDIPDFAPA